MIVINCYWQKENMFNKRTAAVNQTLLIICLFNSTNGLSFYNDTERGGNYSSNKFSHNELTSQNEEQESERVRYLQDVDIYVWLIIPPILMVFGLIGNTLSILVLKR